MLFLSKYWPRWVNNWTFLLLPHTLVHLIVHLKDSFHPYSTHEIQSNVLCNVLPHGLCSSYSYTLDCFSHTGSFIFSSKLTLFTLFLPFFAVFPSSFRLKARKTNWNSDTFSLFLGVEVRRCSQHLNLLWSFQTTRSEITCVSQQKP